MASDICFGVLCSCVGLSSSWRILMAFGAMPFSFFTRLHKSVIGKFSSNSDMWFCQLVVLVFLTLFLCWTRNHRKIDTKSTISQKLKIGKIYFSIVSAHSNLNSYTSFFVMLFVPLSESDKAPDYNFETALKELLEVYWNLRDTANHLKKVI